MSETTATPETRTWTVLAENLGARFAERAQANDEADRFVEENFKDLKAAKAFSLHVPSEFGGGGASYPETCEFLRVLGRHCGSTALAFSMHTHLVAALVWRWKNVKAPVENLLKRVAAEQLVLVSSGGSDWLNGSGVAEKVEGGYKITGRKIFASGSPSGDLLMTTAVLTEAGQHPVVLHFPVSFQAPEVRVLNTWRVLGMRGTGSHDLEITGLMIPDSAATVRRPQGKWHLIMHVVAQIALPLIYSAYVGVAEAARAIARREAAKKRAQPDTQTLVGEMENEWAATQLAWKAMVELGNTGSPGEETTSTVMIYRTLVANAAIHTVEKAMRAVGGPSFYRSLGLERLFRDIQAATYHPLTEKPQARLAGRFALGLPLDDETS